MPQSLASVYLHVVFSTKNRFPFITPEIAPRLHQYLAGIALGTETKLLDVGGMPDHVHLLLSFGREVTIADTVKALKGSSSRWVHDTFGELQPFAWQAGYGAFSVGYPELSAAKAYIAGPNRGHRDHPHEPAELSAAKAYIAGQVEHHRDVTYQDEYRYLLTLNGKKWDERFVWD